MDTDTVDRVNGTDIHVPTETPDLSRPGENGSCFVERFPVGLAGAPISNARPGTPGFQTPQNGLGTENIWAPFQSRRDWEFAQWAKNRGPSSTAVTELLAIDGVGL